MPQPKKTLVELIDQQIETTLDEQDKMLADPSYLLDDRKPIADWNDGWVSALVYIKSLVETKGMVVK